MSAIHDQVSQFLDGVLRNRREVLTPEGVMLPVDLADHGERATALMIDLFIWMCVTALLYVAIIAFVVEGKAVEIAVTLILFIAFIVRNLYFVFFELAWQGATPGKRINGLRVIDRRGGPLTPSAIFARNMTREVEMFLPVGLLLTADAGGNAWESLALLAWLGLFAALPLFNRDHLRGGDFIAGTVVIAIPKRMLLDDLVESRSRYSFTPAQLGAYGAFELQILEELLRRPRSVESLRLLTDVCGRICTKTGWAAPVPPDEVIVFLTEFYSAERAFLERERLFGRSHERVHEAPS